MEGEEQTTAQQLSEGMFARLLLESREEDVIVAVSDSSAISSPLNLPHFTKTQTKAN